MKVDASSALPAEAEPADVARNGLRRIVAEGLLSTGDPVVNAKTVLPWLLASVGAPAAFIGPARPDS